MDSGRLNIWLTSLANIGVLVGLAVLIMEIRQNNELTMAQIEQMRSEAFVSWKQEVALNDHLAPLLAKAEQLLIDMYGEPDDSVDAADMQEMVANIIDVLEPVDQFRLTFYISSSYWDYENVYFQYQRGLVSEDYWSERVVPGIIGYAPQWKGVNGGSLPRGRNEFNDEVERLLSANE
jgi:hypothetical protein